MFGSPHYCYCEVAHQRSVDGICRSSHPESGASGDARPRVHAMAATPDADRPRRSTDPIRLHLAPYSDAALEEIGDVSTASRRLRALAVLSGSLTDSPTAEEAADLVEQQALTVLGASSAVVVTLTQLVPNGPDDAREMPPAAAPLLPAHSRDVLALVHAIGLSADVKATLQRFPLDAPVPLAEVARTGEPIFLESPDELRRYDEWGGALIRAGASAAAAVPVWANRQLRGVLGLTWSAPHVFDEDERAFVISLGVMCAQAIIRGRLTIAERRARETAELANQAKTLFLRTISHELRTPMTAVVGYTGLVADEAS